MSKLMYSNPLQSVRENLAERWKFWRPSNVVNTEQASYHVLTHIVMVFNVVQWCLMLYLASFFTKRSSVNLLHCYALGNIEILRKQNWLLHVSLSSRPVKCVSCLLFKKRVRVFLNPMHIEPPGSLGVISLNHTCTWVKYIFHLTNHNKYRKWIKAAVSSP